MADKDPLRPISYDFEVHFKAFIPNTVQKSERDPWLDEPMSIGFDFKTDNRGFFVDGGTARLHSWAKYSKTLSPVVGSDVGASHMRRDRYYLWSGEDGPNVGPGYTHSDADWSYYTATAKKGSGMVEEVKAHMFTPDQLFVTSSIRLVGEAAYPFSSVSPDIDYEVDVALHFTSAYLLLTYSGEHNKFPGYELYLKKGSKIYEIYSYDPKDKETGPGPVNLNSSLDFAGVRPLTFW